MKYAHFALSIINSPLYYYHYFTVLPQNMTNTKGCPCCFDPELSTFFRIELEENYEPNLVEVIILRIPNRRIYQCQDCQTVFWLEQYEHLPWGPEYEVYHRLPSNGLSIIAEWNRKDLQPRAEFVRMAKEIGLDKWGNGISVPCKIKTIDNEEYDFAKVVFSNEIPVHIYYFLPRVRLFFIDEILEIMPSDYALPYQVRVSKEIELASYVPVRILEAPDNRKFVIDNYLGFLEFENLKGKDMKLSDLTEIGEEDVKYYRNKFDIVWVLAGEFPPQNSKQ